MNDLAELARLFGDVSDPWKVFAAMREQGTPVFTGTPAEGVVVEASLRESLGGRDVGTAAGLPERAFTVFGPGLCDWALTRPHLLSSCIYQDLLGPVMGHPLMAMDGLEHARTRRTLAAVLQPRVARRDTAAMIRRVARDLIAGFRRDGEADLMRQLCRPLPVRVMAHLLGLGQDRREWFQQMSLAMIGSVTDRAQGEQAAGELRAYFERVVEEKRARPGDDLISDLIAAGLPGEQIIDVAMLLLPAGAETTLRGTGNLLFLLLTHRLQARWMWADPGKLLPLAVREAYRVEPPLLMVPRLAVEDVDLGGVTIPEGALVSVATADANRHPQFGFFPGSFSIQRHLGVAWKRPDFTFGRGRHLCLGAGLAGLEGRILAEAVHELLPRARLAWGARALGYPRGLIVRNPPELRVWF